MPRNDHREYTPFRAFSRAFGLMSVPRTEKLPAPQRGSASPASMESV